MITHKLIPGMAIACILMGCNSPEDGRPRGGGAGADGGNYRSKPVAAPSKINGTQPWPVSPLVSQTSR